MSPCIWCNGWHDASDECDWIIDSPGPVALEKARWDRIREQSLRRLRPYWFDE